MQSLYQRNVNCLSKKMIFEIKWYRVESVFKKQLLGDFNMELNFKVKVMDAVENKANNLFLFAFIIQFNQCCWILL